MAALRRLSALQVRVLRDGRRDGAAGARAGARRHRAAGRRRCGGGRRAPARAGPAAGGRGGAHRRIGAGGQGAGGRCPRPPAWPTGTTWSIRAPTSPPAAPVRWWWPPARTPRSARIAEPDRARRGAEDAAGAAPGAVRPRAGGGGAGAVRGGGAARPVARAAAGRGADGGHQPDGVDGARRPAGGDDHRAGGGHAAHGRARRDHPPPVGRGDAGLDHRDLQRQDRHADAQRDDGRSRCGCPTGAASCRSSRRRLRARGRAVRRRPGRCRQPADAGAAARLLQAARAVQRRAAAAARRRARRLDRARRPDRRRAAGAGAQGRHSTWRDCAAAAPRQAELPFDADSQADGHAPPARRRAARAC